MWCAAQIRGPGKCPRRLVVRICPVCSCDHFCNIRLAAGGHVASPTEGFDPATTTVFHGCRGRTYKQGRRLFNTERSPSTATFGGKERRGVLGAKHIQQQWSVLSARVCGCNPLPLLLDCSPPQSWLSRGAPLWPRGPTRSPCFHPWRESRSHPRSALRPWLSGIVRARDMDTAARERAASHCGSWHPAIKNWPARGGTKDRWIGTCRRQGAVVDKTDARQKQKKTRRSKAYKHARCQRRRLVARKTATMVVARCIDRY